MQKLLAFAFLGALCAAPGLAAAAAPSTQILQQRTADGRLLLTDHPAAGAKTERSWQVDHEDPAAARQRAIDVKAEANLVSERVQRLLEMQQRRADDDALRARMAMLERDRMTGAEAQDGIGYGWGGGFVQPTPFRASRFPGPKVGDAGVMAPTGTRGMGGRHGGHGGHGKPSGSGSPGNR